MSEQNETHCMGRRCQKKNYRLPGAYHITINVAEREWQPLGQVVGNLDKPDGDADAPRVELTDIGKMVEEELTKSITAHYPMIEIQDHVVMPEHLHFIAVVHHDIISKSGRPTHLGQVISGFKKGCNRRYWEMTGLKAEGYYTKEQQGNEQKQQGKPADASSPQEGTPSLRHAVHPHGQRPPSTSTTNRPPLFAYGYVDVMPLQPGQLDIQRRYIYNNPRSRLMRNRHPHVLHPQRGGIDTALKLPALKGYLQRECGSSLFNEETWTQLMPRLLISDGLVTCDSYGNRQLLQHRLLPIVCHRKDKASFLLQKQRCLSAAAEGAVLVSARIAKGEQEIIDTAIQQGFPVITIEDNGLPDLYHPSERRIELCATNKLLIVTPWRYIYRHTHEPISVAECKTMNCIVQALCRTKDSWWKTQ
ncbi:MAG: hypothetical protein J6M19_03300 [Bacteroidaceae bacterium]|nr:hypothetical protein [Bacteroidaceae bacterium]